MAKKPRPVVPSLKQFIERYCLAWEAAQRPTGHRYQCRPCLTIGPVHQFAVKNPPFVTYRALVPLDWEVDYLGRPRELLLGRGRLDEPWEVLSDRIDWYGKDSRASEYPTVGRLVRGRWVTNEPKAG